MINTIVVTSLMAGYATYIAQIGQKIGIKEVEDLLESGSAKIEVHSNSMIIALYKDFHITIFKDGELRVVFPPEGDQSKQLLEVAGFLQNVFNQHGLDIDASNLLLNADVVNGMIPDHVLSKTTNDFRPTLGPATHINIYRRIIYLGLFHELGTKAWDTIYKVGSIVGGTYFGTVSDQVDDTRGAVDQLKQFFWDQGLGILQALDTSSNGIVRLRLDESLSSSGLPNLDEKLCFFEAGIIAGFYSKLSNKKAMVKEEKCLANGDDYCEFAIYI